MILVTGGTGFIGRALVGRLLKRGHPVRLLARSREKARSLFPGAEIVKGDILDRDAVKKALRGAGTVIHLAGLISYTLPKERIFRVNLEGTKTLLEASGNVDKFIFSSSTSVYGETHGKASELTPPNPRNFYGESKLAAEKAILASGIPSLIYRLAVVYGTGSPIWDNIMSFFSRGFPVPRTHNVVNLIHISDVTRAFLTGLKKGRGIYIIAGQTIPFMGLASLLSYHLEIKPRFWPVWLVRLLASFRGRAAEIDAFIMNRDFDGSKAKEELGFVPEAYLEREIKKMVEAYKSMNKKT
jgi:nucleoside-diphosphate-sugar epimerase